MERVLARLARETAARVAFVVNRSGQLLASSEEPDALPDLGRSAREGSIAAQLKQFGTAVEFRDHRRTCLHVHLAGPCLVLVVVTRARRNPGQLYPTIRRASEELRALLEEQLRHESEFGLHPDVVAPLSAGDIDALFG